MSQLARKARRLHVERLEDRLLLAGDCVGAACEEPAESEPNPALIAPAPTTAESPPSAPVSASPTSFAFPSEAQWLYPVVVATPPAAPPLGSMSSSPPEAAEFKVRETNRSETPADAEVELEVPVRSLPNLGTRLRELPAVPLLGDVDQDGELDAVYFLDGLWLVDVDRDGAWGPDDVWLRLGHPGDEPLIWEAAGRQKVAVRTPDGDILSAESEFRPEESRRPAPHYEMISGPQARLAERPATHRQ